MSQYICGRCGNSLDKSARICPQCGVKLGSIRCKHCGFSGSQLDFTNDRCPSCHTAVKAAPARAERCKECGHKLEPGQWTCPACGSTQWGAITGLGAAALGCLAAAVIFLPLPTVWTLLVGGIGVVLFFSAFYGIGGALRWHGWMTFMITALMLAMLTLASLAARYRFSSNELILETPADVVAAAALTYTPIPTMTAAPSLTPVPSSTPQITGVVQTQLANMRSGPGTDFAVVGGVVQDEVIVLVGRNAAGDWIKVKTQKDTAGWVFAQLIKLPLPAGDLPEVP